MLGKVVSFKDPPEDAKAKIGLLLSRNGRNVIVLEAPSAISEPLYCVFEATVSGDALYFRADSKKLAEHLGIHLPATFQKKIMWSMGDLTVSFLMRRAEQLLFGPDYVMEDLAEIFRPVREESPQLPSVIP